MCENCIKDSTSTEMANNWPKISATAYTAEPWEGYISTCCEAAIKSDCGDEGTCYAVCTKCGKQCDWKEEVNWFQRLIRWIFRIK